MGLGSLVGNLLKVSGGELMITDIVVVISIMEQQCGTLKVYSEHLQNGRFHLWRRQWHPLQYSCLENPMVGGAWWAAVHGY